MLHTFLFATPTQHLRVAWAPEEGRVKTCAVVAAVGAVGLLYAASMMMLGLMMISLPVVGLLALSTLLYAAAAGSPHLRLRVHGALASVEGFFAAVLLGITGCPAPTAQPPLV